jgi:very-short-patch-repair endonuclease
MSGRLTDFAKNLRRNATSAEADLWSKIRDKQISGVKFRRQQPIGRLIVDFVSFESRVIIEVDGGQHAETVEDVERDAFLTDRGFTVLRFWNNEVLKNLDGVLEVIREACSG